MVDVDVDVGVGVGVPAPVPVFRALERASGRLSALDTGLEAGAAVASKPAAVGASVESAPSATRELETASSAGGAGRWATASEATAATTAPIHWPRQKAISSSLTTAAIGVRSDPGAAAFRLYRHPSVETISLTRTQERSLTIRASL